MPILDPILQYQLVIRTQKSDPKQKNQFLQYFLDTASQNIYRSSETIKAYIQFKKDFQHYFDKLKKYFNLKDQNEINLKEIPDLYSYLNERISENGQEKTINGDYFTIKSNNYDFNYFQPHVNYSDQHSWFLCNSPIAILCLRIEDIHEKHLGLILLETDLMQAAGYMLILCVSITNNYFDISDSFLGDLILNHNFAEVHINYDSENANTYKSYSSFYDMMCYIYNNYDKFDSYFYLYSQHLNISETDSNVDTNKLYNIYKKLKKSPHFILICFGDAIKKSLQSINECVSELESCFFYQSGFENNMIKVILCDIPIYDSDDDVNNLIPIEFAFHHNTNCICYIDKEDFVFWKNGRVRIGENKYADFDDIHYINPDLYVKHTMLLGKVKSNEMQVINKIITKTIAKCEEKESDDFRKEFFLTLFNDKKEKKLLSYVLYALKKNNKDFKFYNSQVFVAYKTIDFCIQHRFNPNNSGFVYQVNTGEGKSKIVILIAAVLALFGKTVHVVTSNIILANRDYNDSYKFFKQLGLKSAVLIHENEKPNFDSTVKEENYPWEYYNHDVFKNSMEMNFDVCGITSDKGKADIVFSNLINFESMYLYMSEKYPGRVEKFYKKCSLVIDEADLILIDELTNGTILSRSMKSNGEEILSYVYDCRTSNKKTTSNEVHNYIKTHWPECTDIKPKDIDIMFQEIDLVNEDEEFVVEKKYALEKMKLDEDKKQKPKNNVILKEVVPFNYDHTGILERNKEFGGFIQQFIALKERRIKKNLKENEHLVVKDVSMNYLYISHPIYVSFYSNVCGLTGTVGNASDKKIFKDHYRLQTRKVPKENPNRRYDFPVILSITEKERNEQIVKEIIAFHKKGNPVLAIFHSKTDIEEVKKGIENHDDFKSNKVDIGVYDGKDEKIKPADNAGEEGAISLGTNICGRGTDITVGKKPLHVIVAFFTPNVRAMNQAFGRTARQEKFGTVRTICLLKEYLIGMKELSEDNIRNSLGMIGGINEMQNDFIRHFRETRKWIFDIKIKSQKIPDNYIKEMRSVLINVNRINAYDFKFPLCMKYKTFLKIQAQKIFSLYNCPNSKYTWRLFQQYIREMILESWSLCINRAERKYNNLSDKAKNDMSYDYYLWKKKCKLLTNLRNYLPEDKNKIDIVPTFMNIFRIVAYEYSNMILRAYKLMSSDDNTEEDKSVLKTTKLSMIKIGFRPYSLNFKSGAKIYNLIYNQPQISYIEDPELKYQRRGEKFLSITEKIDNIFESICNFFSRLIGRAIGFKFFLRRTLGGCEFGICYDFDVDFNVQYTKEELEKLQNCLIDRDPLFVFSISVKSMVPFLAGVLIFFLLYLANIARQMATFITQMPKLSVKVVKKTAISLAKLIAEKAFNEFEDRIVGKLCDYLKGILDKQISKFRFEKEGYYLLIKMLSDLLIDKIPDAAEKMYNGISPKIKINTKSTFGKIAANGMEHIFKVGFLLVLCAASFLIEFQIKKSIKYSNSKVAAQMTKGENYKDKDRVDDYVEDNEKIFNKEIPKVE